MAYERITKAKESSHVQVKREMHACVFFDSMGIVHKEWDSAGQSVNITRKIFLKDLYGFVQILPQTGSFTTTMRQPMQGSL